MLDRRPRIMFLCTGNSCRSQMAEGWARALHPTLIDPCSAGTQPKPVDPLAVHAMAEAGVDISSQASKPIAVCDPGSLDVVATVCDAAAEACPSFVGRARVVRQSFDDPPRLAAGARSDEEAMAHYRRVRDEIRAFVQTLPRLLDASLYSGDFR
jgi:arsenate reductase